MKNPFIVEPEVKKLDFEYAADGAVHHCWITVKRELNIGESRAMMRGVQTVTQAIARDASSPNRAEAKLEWTEYSFARMAAYIVDWSLAHEPEIAMAPTRANFEKLKHDLFDVIDGLLDAHEKAVADEKKATATTR